MEHASPASGSNRLLIAAIGLIVLVYLVGLFRGVPQGLTERIAQAEAAEAAATAREASDPPAADPPEGGAHQAEAHEAPVAPPLWTVLPFALLLGAIAVLPLVPGASHWWDHNRNRFLVAAVLAAITLVYYLVWFEAPVTGHFPAHYVAEPNAAGWNVDTTLAVLGNAMLNEYIPFIVLLFTLYTISGGIRVQGDLPAHPLTNSTFLAIGAVLANFIGTTGAAMLLIRPLLETNRERKHVIHTVIFFIFVVCNCGGCLLPLGDPPLFLGYLRGVPFLYTLSFWPEWLFVNGMLVAIYFLWDTFLAYPKETRIDVVRDEVQVRGVRLLGLWPNAVLLLLVIPSLALLDPAKPFPGTDWRPWVFLREVVQLTLVALSLVLGNKEIRKANHFNYSAIVEVAALFFGIFICMQAPLQILHVKGPEFGLTVEDGPKFFFMTGSLSSVLDNAPTYVVFMEAARSLEAPPGTHTVAGAAEVLLAAVSLGAVFMGSMTYIGNGPNFMVKAIAEKSGIRMPSFFGYMLYSVGILLPLFIVTVLLFLR